VIINPKFVALDSSHLGAVARDKYAKDGALRQRAAAFERAFDASGSILLLSWLHIQELLSHHNRDVVAQRVAFIRSLPMVASVVSVKGGSLAGTIIDLQAREAAIAFENPQASILAVRDEAAKAMFRLGSGADLIEPFMESWSALQPEFARQAARIREVVAISRSGFAEISDRKIVDMLKGTLRAPEAIDAHFELLHRNLFKDIQKFGDKRIADPEYASAQFLNEVKRLGIDRTNSQNPGLQILLASGVGLSEIGPDTTVGDVGALAMFRAKLAVLNEYLDLPWQELKERVTESRLPSGFIHSALVRFRPVTGEWKGSDLPDSYLACLSPYADVTFVDKRTHEAFRRARQKLEDFSAIVRRVEKASDYESLLTHLI